MTQENVCKTVLIVEDNESIRETLRTLLEMEGYTAICAENGKEALEKLEATVHPCLILCDLMMPVMNGWEFIAEIKKDKLHGFAVIPIIVVSAAGNHTAVGTAKGIVEGYIKKPLDFEILIKVVERYCGPSRKQLPTLNGSEGAP